MVRQPKKTPLHLAVRFMRRFLVAAGAILLTLAFFLVLPLMQTLTRSRGDDMVIQTIDTANLPPPPPPPEEPPEEEPEPEEPPPELSEEAPPLTLDQLALALNPGLGDGWFEGDFAVNLNTIQSNSEDMDELFSLSNLDQKPRAIYQPQPVITSKMRRKGGGTVYIIFVVNRDGRVQNPTVQTSPDPMYEKAALDAIKKWKFEPGKRNGKPVRFRMRVPITFPEG